MPLNVNNEKFYTMSEVAERAGVARQTIWRWKRDDKIPNGRRYRGRELLFTSDEVVEICDYAHRIEPEGSSSD